MFVFDLPIEDCEDIAKRHNVGWLTVIDDPLQSGSVATAVVMAVAKKLGLATPELGSVRTLHGMITIKDDDLPVVYEGGLPNGEAAAETLGSSGP